MPQRQYNLNNIYWTHFSKESPQKYIILFSSKVQALVWQAILVLHFIRAQQVNQLTY